MKPRLQKFDHRSSAYERPSQSWVCGRASTGKPCALGPDQKGGCRTLSECRPHRQGEAWVCNRPSSAGGPCEAGPLPNGQCCRSLPPCIPVRSLRSRRGRFTAVATLFCFGLLLFLFGSRINTDLVDAGAVYAGHVEVEACSDCHINFDGGPIRWFKAAFADADPVADNDKCVACHKWGPDAANAHTLPRSELADLIGKFEQTAATAPVPWSVQMSRSVFPIPHEAQNGPLACGACHKEHKGEDADLLAVSNARCQSCHQVTFNAFSDGHPSFGNYPYLRRTRIIFDHDSHNRKNFPEKAKQGVKPPETCDSCHAPDATGQFMLTQDFEDTCALCHSEDIIGETVAGPKGTPIIAVPELDLETLAERGFPIGDWPEFPVAIDVSPYTKLLIAADPTIAEDLVLVQETDFQDLSDVSDAEVLSVARVAMAVKELLFDLSISGVEILEDKVQASLDKRLDTDTVGRLVGHIPQDVIAAAAAAWFPNLKQEVVAYRKAKQEAQAGPAIQGTNADDDLSDNRADVRENQTDPALTFAQAGSIEVQNLAPVDPSLENEALGLPTLDPEEWAKAGGWYRKDNILYYRPVGHEDAVLRTWLDISGQSFGTPAEGYGDAVFQLLADKNTPGKCTKCHSVDQQIGGGLAINWGTFEPVVGETKFTSFVHSTHFSSVGDEGCVACHQLNEDQKYQDSFKERDPLQFHPNFAPMQREACAECHVEQSAGDACTQCHQYHIGEFAAEGIPATRIDQLDKAKPAPASARGLQDASLSTTTTEPQNTDQLSRPEQRAGSADAPASAVVGLGGDAAAENGSAIQQPLPSTSDNSGNQQ